MKVQQLLLEGQAKVTISGADPDDQILQHVDLKSDKKWLRLLAVAEDLAENELDHRFTIEAAAFSEARVKYPESLSDFDIQYDLRIVANTKVGVNEMRRIMQKVAQDLEALYGDDVYVTPLTNIRRDTNGSQIGKIIVHATLVWLRKEFDSPTGHQEQSRRGPKVGHPPV